MTRPWRAALMALGTVPLGLALAALAGCHTKTDECNTGCQQPFHLWPHWCLCSGACSIDEVAVDATACCPVGPTCVPALESQQTLRIPIPWQDIWGGSRIVVDLPGIDVPHMTLLFDGVPATGCTVEPGRFDCSGLTPSVQTLEIRYEGVISPSSIYNVSVLMVDPSCYDGSRGCL